MVQKNEVIQQCFDAPLKVDLSKSCHRILVTVDRKLYDHSRTPPKAPTFLLLLVPIALGETKLFLQHEICQKCLEHCSPRRSKALSI